MHTVIRKAIQENKLVFFIGAGFSRSLGFPNWSKLVEELIDELSIDHPDLAFMKQAIETNYFNEMEILEKLIKHKLRIYELLEKRFSVIDQTHNSLIKHEKIGSISSKIITTNYDKALETANSDFKKVTYDNKYQVAKLNTSDSYIYKLHGCIDDPTSCILFRDDYVKLYNDISNKSSVEELKKIIGDNTIIFLAFFILFPPNFNDFYLYKKYMHLLQ